LWPRRFILISSRRRFEGRGGHTLRDVSRRRSSA
jgi:hypothetical protein